MYRPPADPGDNTDENRGITTATHNSKPSNGYTYGLERLNVPEAQNKFNTKGENVRVAVLDSGIDPSHPAITLAGNPSDNYEGSWAVVNDSFSYDDFPTIEGPEENPPNDLEGHGTHVAGTITGDKVDGTHIGVAPNAELMAGQVTYAGRFYSGSDVAFAVDWAVENNADVISLSLGSNINPEDYNFKPNGILLESIRSAEENGVTVIASSGNSEENTAANVAAYQETISVGATGPDETVQWYSSGMEFNPNNYFTGEKVTPNPPYYSEEDIVDEWVTDDWENPRTVPFVVAPGENVVSADHDSNGLESRRGTSMAAPHVSGIAALAYSNNPELTTEEFRTVLRASADPVAGQPDAYNTRQGHGEVDAVKALELSNPNGYHEVESLTTPDTVAAGDDVEISTTIHNTNIIGGDGATDVALYVNGDQVRTIASNVQVDSTNKRSVSTTYDTTGVSGAVNVSIGTADELQSQTMTVEAEDTTPPVPRLTYTPTSPSPNTTISFDASETTDADSALETYQWDFNSDGTTDATGVTTTHTYTTADEYDVTLTVTDTAGNTNTTTQTVYVRKEVEIRNPTLTPTSVYSSPTSHTLTFNAVNVSADGSRDEFSISIPETVQLEAANSVEVTNKGFTPSYSTENNTIHFDVNRTSSEPSLDLNVRANVTLSSAI